MVASAASKLFEYNPFYVLGVSGEDNRRAIVAACEERSFLFDADLCTEAQNALLNPTKRLAAEFDWFLDSTRESQQHIRECIETGQQIPTDTLGGISELNASLYNFLLAPETDFREIGYAILDMDEQFEAIDTDSLTKNINQLRITAKMATVTEQEVSGELGKKRDRIRQIICEHLSNLERSDYISLVTMLAEECVEQEEYLDGVLLFDIIDHYELQMQAEIEEKADSIESYIERFWKLENAEALKINIQGLIRRVRAWDEIVQPLQLKSKVSGMPHKTSEKVAYAIRKLCLYLHNEKDLTNEALTLVEAMRGVFSELGSLSSLFEDDFSKLKELAQQKTVVPRAPQQKEPSGIVKFFATVIQGARLIIGLGVLVLLLFSWLSDCGSTSGSSTKSTSSHAPATSTAKPDNEVRFTSSTPVGTNVYADIKSIFPAIGIYTEGSSNYTEFVCECKTSSGATVWVHMTAKQYRSYFNSVASTSIDDAIAEEIPFSSSKRIHGTVKRTDSVLAGLSSDTGSSTVIDFKSVG